MGNRNCHDGKRSFSPAAPRAKKLAKKSTEKFSGQKLPPLVGENFGVYKNLTWDLGFTSQVGQRRRGMYPKAAEGRRKKSSMNQLKYSSWGRKAPGAAGALPKLTQITKGNVSEYSI